MSFSYYIFSFTKEIDFLHTPFLLFIALIPFLLILKIKDKNTLPKNTYRSFFKIVFFIIIWNTIIFSLFHYSLGDTVASFGIYFQIITAYFFRIDKFNLFFKNFEIVAFISIILVPFLYTGVTIDTEAVTNRDTLDDSFYTFAGSFWVVIPFVLYSVLEKTKLKLALILWGVTVALNMLFLKRFIIVDSLILAVAIFFIQLNEKNKLFNKFNLLILLFLPIAIYFIMSNTAVLAGFDATLERISDQKVDAENFDRFRETANYFKNEADIFDLIIGRGFSGMHQGYNHIALALHTGWANFILKGGVLLLILVLIPIIKSFRLLSKFKYLPNEIKFSVLYLLISSVRFSYINMHNYRPELLIFFCCAFLVMDYNRIKNTR